MKELLKDEYPAYERCMQERSFRGLRVNLLKTDAEKLFSLCQLNVRQAPFIANGYYLEDDSTVADLNAYRAGLFYMQEPSASAAVEILDPRPGMKILDMCAAPGSKTTAILERMQNQGFLCANEIHPKRVQILRENVERHGAANCLVLNSTPAETAEAFPEFFDMILCDAPCSGEGMFRKDPQAQLEWSPENVQTNVGRQHEILNQAYKALRPGGVIVYSTCTFNLDENEKQIMRFLEEHSDMHMEKTGVSFGRPAFELGHHTDLAVRIFPMDQGEGHFIARMRKDEGVYRGQVKLLKSMPLPKQAESLLDSLLQKPYPYYYVKRDLVFAGTAPFYDFGSCRPVRHQVLAGTMKNGRFEPSHHLFMSSYCGFRNSIELNDEELKKYLHGEQLNIARPAGWYAVKWNGYVLGGVKSDGKALKNKYPKQYRVR